MKKIMTYFTLMTVLFCIFICKGFALDESDFLEQDFENYIFYTSDNFADIMKNTLGNGAAPRSDCDPFSCNTDDLIPLVNTSWRFTYEINGSLFENIISFAGFPCKSPIDESTARLSCLRDTIQSEKLSYTLRGTGFYLSNYPSSMGGGSGYQVRIYSEENPNYTYYYHFKIANDGSASGYFQVLDKAAGAATDSVTMSGICISTKGDTSGDGKIGLEEAVNALKIVSGIK